MVQYDKAVRDRIPEIIKKNGKTCEFTVVSNDEFLVYLDKKLQEEMGEYLESKNIEELVDLSDVIDQIVSLRGFSVEKFSSIRDRKSRNRGGFENNFVLKSVH